jgi:hypothetical protein
MKLKQIYVLEDQGKYYIVNNAELSQIKLEVEKQTPDEIVAAYTFRRWKKRLGNCATSVNSRFKEHEKKTEWSVKLQNIATGLRWREKEVRKRFNTSKKQLSKKTMREQKNWSFCLSAAASKVNQKQRQDKWKTWCNNASSNLDKRNLRKETEQ